MRTSSGRIAVLAAAATAVATAAVAVPALVRATRGLPGAMGARPGTIRSSEASIRSPHFDGTVFHNRLPGSVMAQGSTFGLMRSLATRGDVGKPSHPVPMTDPTLDEPAAGCAATWLGHASVLLEVDGSRVLADPVWSDRVSPSATVGPRRLHPLPFDPATLPQVDAIVISHDHYDHLDSPTIEVLTRTQQAPFLVPLGVGSHLRAWGVPVERIIELDWDEAATVGDLTIVCTEARHFSGRGLLRNNTLWSSWAVSGPQHRVFFGGDTGYTPAFAGIGARYGPFDLTVLPIGAYGEAWPDIHMNPEEAVQAHGDLGGAVLLPIHWATFDLAFHPWAEPVERLLLAGADRNVRLALPPPGGRVVAEEVPGGATTGWWRDAV